MCAAPRAGALQEVFLTSEYICIVMEYATGGSLFHYVQKQGKLKVRVHTIATREANAGRPRGRNARNAGRPGARRAAYSFSCHQGNIRRRARGEAD